MPNTPTYRLTNRDLVFAIQRVRPILKQLAHLPYHGGNENGSQHTLVEMLPATKELAEDIFGSIHHPLAIEAMFEAVYHDVGMGLDPRTYAGHEERSATYMGNDLRKYHPGMPNWQINRMMQVVRETNPNIEATSQNAMILKDADLAYSGRFNPVQVHKRSDDLRKEVLLLYHPFLTQKAMSDEEWDNLQVTFFSRHVWKTDAARRRYDSRKQETIRYMEQIASRHAA